MNYLLSITIFSPLIGFIAILFMKKDNENLIKWLGVLATVPALLITGWLSINALLEKSILDVSERFLWMQFGESTSGPLYSIYYELGLDGLSLAMMTLTALIATLAAFVSWHIKGEWKGYFLLFLLLEVGMLGLFAAENFILFFLFFEVTLITVFFLIGKWGGFAKEKAAFQFLIYNGLGSSLLLIVIGALFARTRSANFAVIAESLAGNVGAVNFSEAAIWGLFITLFIALGIKLPVVPFHTWMVRVHKEAHPAVVMIHSGILLKIGAYGLIRFGIGIFPDQWRDAAYVIMILGIINILYGAFIALIQKDLRLVLAFSSISHMGFVLLGLGALNEAGIQGAIFQTISHGFISSFLFLLVSIMYERYGTTKLDQLGGMAKTMPVVAGSLMVGGMAALGLPGTSGFIGEFTVLLGSFENQPIIGSIAAFGLILTAAYILRANLQISFGDVGKSMLDPGSGRMLVPAKLKTYEWLPAVVLVGLIIGLGVFPDVLVNIISQSILSVGG